MDEKILDTSSSLKEEVLRKRVYWLDSEITLDTFDLVKYIIEWNTQDKDKAIKDRAPIRIIIDSPGGYLSVSETISNIIKMSKTPIYGIALGRVASGASVIYLSCHKKYALPNTVFILHKGGCSDISGTYDEILAFAKDYEEQVTTLLNFYINNTNYSKEEIEQNIQTDWYIRIEEALTRGIVDRVIDDISFFC